MSQSRFSIVLVGVSALLRRPLVSRLRPAGFTARGSGGFRRSGRPSVSALPLGELTFGLTASAFRHAPLRSCRSAGWPSGSRLPLFGTHRFGVALGGLVFGLTASAFRHAPLRGCPRRVGLRAHGFRFSGCAVSEIAAWRVGSSAFRFGDCPRRVGLRAHGFRFSARADPHRRAADARTDGAHQHDTCFTSKHLFQHVNLPHRTP